MSKPDINAVFERLARQEITPRQAVRDLGALGFGQALAEESVSIALGGGDVIEIGSDGRERFVDSGKLVSEVEAKMKK